MAVVAYYKAGFHSLDRSHQTVGVGTHMRPTSSRFPNKVVGSLADWVYMCYLSLAIYRPTFNRVVEKYQCSPTLNNLNVDFG